MTRFGFRKNRRKHGLVPWMQPRRRQRATAERANPVRDAFRFLGIPIPEGPKGLLVAAGLIFGIGIVLGTGIGFLTAPPSAESLRQSAAATPRSEPLLQAPPIRPPAPASFTPPQFLSHHDMDQAPETGEEGGDVSYLQHHPPEPTGQTGQPVSDAPPPPPAPEMAMAPSAPPPPREPPRPLHRPTLRADAPVELAALAYVPPDALGGPEAPWRRNAVVTPPPDGRPRIAIVIDDLGVDRGRSARIIGLPGPLTAAFLPYAHDLQGQTRMARAAGHELMVHVPMEPRNPDVDPGPDALLTGSSDEQIRHRLEACLARFDAPVGINNHMGSLFTGDARGMAVVMAILKQRGLLFLDSRTTNDTVGPDLARRFGVPFAERHVFIDNENDVGHVRAHLAQLEDMARQHGFAIGIGHPRDGTIEGLRTWLPTLARKGITLVPISAIVRQRMATASTVSWPGRPNAARPDQ
ncbi:MAG: divergent polysaccharide deacetylase family protein [Alphaproteobacteria bacterium]